VLAGCVEVNTSVVENGGAVSTLKIVVHPQRADMVREELRRNYPEWDARQRMKGEQVEFVCRRVYGTNETLPKAATARAKAEQAKASPVQVEMEQQGLTWVYEFEDVSPRPEIGVGEEKTAATIPVRYTLTMPGQITDASTPLIERNKAIWEFTLADRTTEIRATAQVSQLPRLLVLLVCLVALVAGYFLVARAGS